MNTKTTFYYRLTHRGGSVLVEEVHGEELVVYAGRVHRLLHILTQVEHVHQRLCSNNSLPLTFPWKKELQECSLVCNIAAMHCMQPYTVKKS
jgi:hypothetical protein